MTSFARTMAGIISTTGDVKSTVVGDIGLSVYSTLDSLPTSALTSGDQAFVSENNRIYVSNGTGWYNVALLNATPTLSISPSGAVTLATDGSTPTIITLTATDSDNADASLIYTVESDGSFANIATLSQDSSVFTITPLAEGSATPGSSTLTFKVSDGISFGSGTTQFSLTFGPDWANATESKLVASDAQASDYFGGGSPGIGADISADNNYVVVGAWQEDGGAGDPVPQSGAAYIYVRSGSTWTQQAILRASDAQEGDYFGYSTSINSDGTYALIGAFQEDTGGSSAGAAYIFTRSGSTWTQQQKIQASDAQESDQFSFSASINSTGTYAIVGARLERGGVGDPLSNAGAAYIFTRSGSTWTQQAKIVSSDLQASDQFGYSASINSDGTYAIVTASFESGGVGDPVYRAGAAYIFTRSGSTWTQQQKITASDAQAEDYFGYNADISADGIYAIVGSRFEDGGAGDPLSAAGAAYIFVRSGSTWTEQAILRASDAAQTKYFGQSVSINSDGSTVIIGSPPSGQAGSVYIFTRSGSTWTEKAIITASDTQSGDEFGNAVSINGDGTYVIVAALGEDGGVGDPLSNAGAAYVYEAG